MLPLRGEYDCMGNQMLPSKGIHFLIVQLLLNLYTIQIIREADTEIPHSAFRIPNFFILPLDFDTV